MANTTNYSVGRRDIKIIPCEREIGNAKYTTYLARVTATDMNHKSSDPGDGTWSFNIPLNGPGMGRAVRKVRAKLAVHNVVSGYAERADLSKRDRAYAKRRSNQSANRGSPPQRTWVW
jgi:hypothetical protein